MTKRFEFGDSINLVIDNVESNSYGSYNITSLIKVLNELHEENQRLNQTLENIQKELNKYNNEWVDL